MFSFVQNYLFWSLPNILLAFAVLFLLHPFRQHLQKKKGLSSTLLHELGLFLFAAYMAVLCSLTLNLDQIWVFVYYGWPLPSISFFTGHLNLKLFSEILTSRDLWMLLGNVMLFLPFGFLSSLLWEQKTWWRVCLFGALLSFSIESFQFMFVGRWFDTTDILMNTIGTLLGFLVWRMLTLPFSSFAEGFRCIKQKMSFFSC